MKVTQRTMSGDWKVNPTLLQDTLAAKQVGLHTVVVAGGAGKTHAVKALLKAENPFNPSTTYWLISPYAVQRTDYESVGAIYMQEIPFNVKHHVYSYINNILADIRDLGSVLELDEDRTINVVAAMIARANPNMKIILDEFDTLVIQAKKDKHTEIVNGQTITTKDYSGMFDKFLTALGEYLPVVKLSATVEPEEVFTKVALGTSVRTPVINNHVLANQSNQVAADYLLDLVDDATMKGNPVLVYKSHYEPEYYGVMAKLAAMGISTLLLTRNERLTTNNDATSKIISYAHETFNFYKVDGSESPLKGSMRGHLMVVENDAGLPLPELLREYQVVFINMGHSRVISVFQNDLDNQVEDFTVITIGKQLTNAGIQAEWRPRDFNVEVHNILTGDIKAAEKPLYEGDTGFDYLSTKSPCSNEYGIQEINLVWNPKVNTLRVKGARVGQAVGKAISPKTLAKQTALKEFLTANPKGSYPLYQSVVAKELQYSINQFGTSKKAI